MSQSLTRTLMPPLQPAEAAAFAATLYSETAESVLETQSSLLRGVEEATLGWLERRREAVDETERLLTRMVDCRSLDDLLEAQQNWVAGALQRLALDSVSFNPALVMLAYAPKSGAARTTAQVTSLPAPASGRKGPTRN